MNKFIIFAHARSGSTSLAKVLGKSPDVKIAIEPFHPDYKKWNPIERKYCDFVKDEKTLNKALEKIFSKYTAMKTLDYQMPEEIYYKLLSKQEFKIIHLQRKNLLEAAISNAVGEQTKEWQKFRKDFDYNKLKPVKVKKIKDWMEYVVKLTNRYSEFLKNNRKGDYITLYYEDLYSNSLEENRKTLTKICKFLGIAIPPDHAIEKFMMPSKAKINYKNIYKKIPNYDEIIKKLSKSE